MNKEIVAFIKSYNISDLEIEDMKNIAPMLEVTTYEEFVTNCALLEIFGYPRCDLDVLMLANPNIFAMSERDLKKELTALKEKYDDIEQILKEDPTII